MRKFNIRPLFLAVALGVSTLFTGCALTQNTASGVSVESSTVSASTATQSSASVVVTPEPSPTAVPAAGLSTQEIVAAYEAYATFVDYWYRGGNGEAMQAETTSYQDMAYCRYEADGVKTLGELQSKALELMTQPLLDALQENLLYVDVAGALYGPVNYGSGSEDSFAKDECETVQVSDTQYQLKVGHYYYAHGVVEDADAEALMLRAETTAVYSKTEAGWRFSSVEYVPTTIVG